MPFNSFSFALFFLIVAAIHWSPAPVRVRKCSLVLFSYLFYASWTLKFLPVLLCTTALDYVVARTMDAETRPLRRKILCIGGISAGLAVLAFFKYRHFLYATAVALCGAGGHAVSHGDLPVATLPLGISFYTFESISYLVDVYRRTCKPAVSLLDYALFIAFFPHLLAGPIVRPKDLLPQLATLLRPSRDQLGWGMTLITMGLFQKIVVADQMAVIANRIFDSGGRCGCLDMWTGTLAFSLQIYCDFSGYSLCAIGMALVLGLVLRQNFNAPYAAVGFVDFWRRWHISLSTWLRDYLYIPLGGSRLGALRTVASLMITMVLGGLWHGASWTFVVWGFLHGLLLVGDHLLRRACAGMTRFIMGSWSIQILLGLLTFLVIDLLWVLFRTHHLADAWSEYLTMGGWTAGGIQVILRPSQVWEVMTVLIATLAVHWYLRGRDCWAWWAARGWIARAIIISAMITLMLLTPGENLEFIYFQF